MIAQREKRKEIRGSLSKEMLVLYTVFLILKKEN